MKIKLLFLALSIAPLSFGQALPTPVYSHDFTGTLTSTGFTANSSGISLNSDRNNTPQRAALLDPGHGLLSLNIQDHKTELMEEGTISLWFQYGGSGTSAFGSEKPLVFWSNGNSSYSEGVVLTTTAFATVKVISYRNSSVGGVEMGNPASGASNITGTWHHFAVSWKFGEDGFIKGYFDGVNIVTRNHDFYMPGGTLDNIIFTGFNSSHSSSLHGKIDEIKVFTEALTDDQIEKLYDPNICYVNIPDANFKNALISHSPTIDTNGNGKISCDEAEAFTGYMTLNEKNISDLTGLEAFTKMTALSCRNNNLTSLDVSSNTLLNTLLCYNNNLTSLNVSSNTLLKVLLFNSNNLTNVDLSSNILLEELQFQNNQLTNLNLSGNTALKYLFCQNNRLTSLDLSTNTQLLQFKANDNHLTSLNIANGNNTNFVRMEVYSNPNLTCIQVDDASYSSVNWAQGVSSFFQKPENAVWSEDCAAIVGVSELGKVNPISVYPNPTLGIVHLSEISDVQIFDMSGRLILEQNNTNTIDLSNEESGVYILKTNSQNGVGTARIIKE